MSLVSVMFVASEISWEGSACGLSAEVLVPPFLPEAQAQSNYPWDQAARTVAGSTAAVFPPARWLQWDGPIATAQSFLV